MEESLYFLVYSKQDKKYILRSRNGESFKFIEKFNIKTMDFCGRTKDYIFIKCCDTLYQIAINGKTAKEQYVITTQTVDDVMFCIYRGILLNFDGQELNYFYNNSNWKEIQLDDELNDVELMYCLRKKLIIIGTNMNEEPRMMQLILEKNNRTKRMRTSTNKDEKEEEENDDDDDDDDDAIKVTMKQFFKFKKNQKIIALQSFKEDKTYLYYILSIRKKQQKEYKVFREDKEIALSVKADVLNGFLIENNTLFLYGQNNKHLVFYKYNFNNKFELIETEQHPQFFKKKEITKKVFPLMLNKKEKEILTKETFIKKSKTKKDVPFVEEEEEVEEKNIIFGKRKRPVINYDERFDDDDEDERYSSSSSVSYDSDEIEYINTD